MSQKFSFLHNVEWEVEKLCYLAMEMVSKDFHEIFIIKLG